MKPVISTLSGLLFFCLLTGCAGSPARTADNPPPDDQGDYKIISTPFGDIKRQKTATDDKLPASVVEAETPPVDEDAYEIISTPFGYVKRKKKTVESVSAPDGKPTAGSVPSGENPPAAARPSPSLDESASPKGTVTGEMEVPPAGALPPPETGASGPVSVSSEAVSGVESPAAAGDVSFDFDNADLDAVIRAMADFLGINYIVDPGITGKVTIHTAGRLKAADVFPVFYQTLEVNGLSAVKEGNVYRILKSQDVSRMPITPRIGDSEEIAPEERIILQIIPLKYISAPEVTKVIAPFISPEGTIISEGTTNTLLVLDKGINIFKILKLIEVFDVSVFDRINYRFYTLQNASAGDVSKTLESVLPPVAAGGKEEVKFIPIEWLNSLLVVSPNREAIDNVKSLIHQLDVPSEGAQPQIYVYSVKNGMAVDLGDTMRAIFAGAVKSTQVTKRESVPTNPFARGARDKEKSDDASTAKTAASNSSVKTGSTESSAGPSATLRGEVRITDDQIRNALIIEALPGDYKIIKRILERLDVLPRQVLIDVVIAEISLGQGTELGIEWNFKKEDWSDTGSLAATIGDTGLQYALGLSKKWQAALHALANDSKLNIISSPTVLASDNKPAQIDVTTEVPIPSSNYTYVNDGDNVLETNVEYRDTGVILDVTPHINEYGLVTMDISQEVSNVGNLIKVAGQDYYSFDRKKILTSLTVKHNQSIVIGGLISREKKNASSGVPWLAKIPIIRWLTGTEKKEASRSELIVMITPRVITSLEDVDAVSQEFKNKIAGVLRSFVD